MKLAYPVSIKEFTKHIIQGSEAKKIMDGWPLEDTDVVNFVVDHFSKLGVFQVEPLSGSDLIYSNTLFLLRNSPELANLVSKTNKQIEKDIKARSFHD